MKRVVILQSSYIPWKGYFDLISSADTFVFLDDVQFTSRDWRSRNRIKAPARVSWMSIPAGSPRGRRICDVEVLDQGWKRQHRRMIERCYTRAPFFDRYQGLLDFLYDNDITNLSEYNQRAIVRLAELLGVRTTFVDSRSLSATGTRTARLIDILTKVGGTHYLSGPAARAYLNEAAMAAAGVSVEWKRYDEYPAYPQLHGAFVHEVSILDVLFHVGPDAPRYVFSGSVTARPDPSS